MGSKCCPFAIGASWNGSVSIPAALNGIYAFKPTTGRFTTRGIGTARKDRFEEFDYFQSAICPMGQSVEDCIVGFKVMANPAHQKDPFQAPSQWNDLDFICAQSDQNPVDHVKIGILEESPFLPCTEAVKRAMKITKQALKDLGYNVVPFFLTDEVWDNARDLIASMMANGTCPGIFEEMQNESETIPDVLQPMWEMLMGNQTYRSLYDKYKEIKFGRAREMKSRRQFKPKSP